MLIISGTIRIEPSAVGTFLAAAKQAMEVTRSEPGCLSYHFSPDLLEDGTINVFERWSDQDSLAAHLERDHLRVFRKAINELGERTADVVMYAAEDLGRPPVPPLAD